MKDTAMPHDFDTTRREFLRIGLGVGLGALGVPSWLEAAATASSRDRRLVVLELTGGNDALNMVIPFADDRYHRLRPQLRIPGSQVLRLGDHFGLHPRMGALHDLYHAGRLAVVHGVGYANPDRSHFRALDIWHSAAPELDRPRTGWIGRAADRRQPGEASPFAMRVGGRDLPLLLRSEGSDVPTLDRIADLGWDRGPEGARSRRRRMQESLLAASAGGNSSGTATETRKMLARAWGAAMRDSARLTAAVQQESAAEYPGGELARRLRLTATLLGSELGPRVVHLDQGGYDTHANQSQPHAQLLGDLSAALGAFWSDLDGRGLADEVLMVIYSEFGRRVAENASAGTDHGAAAPVLLISGAVQGGLLGAPPSLADLDDGDLRYQVDFRRIYATLLEPWLGVPAAPILGGEYAPLAIV